MDSGAGEMYCSKACERCVDEASLMLILVLGNMCEPVCISHSGTRLIYISAQLTHELQLLMKWE